VSEQFLNGTSAHGLSPFSVEPRFQGEYGQEADLNRHRLVDYSARDLAELVFSHTEMLTV